MRIFKFLFLAFVLAIPVNVFGGVAGFRTDRVDNELSAYYDLRDRSSFIQVTNLDDDNPTCRIHIQIFQHDRDCSEVNFFDTLTPNDTVVYDLDNLIRNDDSPVPASLNDDSYGYVVVVGDIDDGCEDLIGNFRIIDDADYEYRTNMPGESGPDKGKFYTSFNTIEEANQADIVGYSYHTGLPSVVNNDFGMDFDIFVFDLDEEPLSCDRRNFACGKVMNYGVNEDYPNSIGGPLLCPGGGLADPDGGYILFDNWGLPADFVNPGGSLVSAGFTGINNGNGTGSMDMWFFEGQ